MNCLRDFAEQVLGSCELVEDCSWAHRMSSVFRFHDSDGSFWFLKQHRDHERYRAELAAYTNWVPALHDAAPRLRAFDDSLHALILSQVPGTAPPWPAPQMTGLSAELRAEQAVQRQAGRVLRMLHDARPPLPWPDFAAAKLSQFDDLKMPAAGLLQSRELDKARALVSGLADLPAPARVPCHHDYTPRNWLVRAGALHVIDFEWSGLDARVADLARLYLGIWADRPDLRDAFLTGYGQELSASDWGALHGCAAVTAVWLLVKAHETRQPSFEDGSRRALLRLIEGADL